MSLSARSSPHASPGEISTCRDLCSRYVTILASQMTPPQNPLPLSLFEPPSDLCEIYRVGTHDQDTIFIACKVRLEGLLDTLIIVIPSLALELNSTSFE